MKKLISVLIVLVTLSSIYAQTSRRILEVKRPRMNGEDVKQVQTKLVELGFTDVGEIDGYYGPKSEAAVKELKGLIGVPVDGFVNDYIYDFFDSKAFDIISPVIKTYNQKKNDYDNIVLDESYDFNSLVVKGFKINNSKYCLIAAETTAYNPNGDPIDPFDLDAKYEFKTEYSLYILYGKTFYQVKEGKLVESSDESFLELMNEFKKKNR